MVFVVVVLVMFVVLYLVIALVIHLIMVLLIWVMIHCHCQSGCCVVYELEDVKRGLKRCNKDTTKVHCNIINLKGRWN